MVKHTNWLCPTKWAARLDALLSKLHDPYCYCQVEPWNYLTKAQRKRQDAKEDPKE